MQRSNAWAFATRASSVGFAAALALACGARDRDAPGSIGDAGGGYSDDAASAGPGFGPSDASTHARDGCNAIDIVVVIDPSTSMHDEQNSLKANLPDFVDVLDGFTGPNGPVDYRIGVTDASLTHVEKTMFGSAVKQGTDGKLVRASACQLARPWIERGDAARKTDFACLASILLTDAGGFEMPLGALEQAITTANPGYLRDDALLGVILITDEDDKTADPVPLDEADDGCPLSSPWAKPVGGFIDALDRVKGQRREAWSAAIIAGKGPGECKSAFGSACEARRLAAFGAQAGSNVVVSSICDGDLKPALGLALAKFRLACDALKVR